MMLATAAHAVSSNIVVNNTHLKAASIQYADKKIGINPAHIGVHHGFQQAHNCTFDMAVMSAPTELMQARKRAGVDQVYTGLAKEPIDSESIKKYDSFMFIGSGLNNVRRKVVLPENIFIGFDKSDGSDGAGKELFFSPDPAFRGDSGGPLFGKHKENGAFYVLGIIGGGHNDSGSMRLTPVTRNQVSEGMKRNYFVQLKR